MGDLQCAAFMDALYDAALQPQRWDDVLCSLADMTGGSSAWLAHLDLRARVGSGVVSRIDPAMQDLYFSRFAPMDPFAVTPAAGADRSSLFTDESFLPKEDLIKTEFYNDFMRLLDVHAIAVLRLRTQGSFATSIHINRSKKAGPFDAARLDCLRRLGPHLSRAVEMSRKVGPLDVARRDAADVLDRARHGVFILDAGGQLQHANREAERILRQDAGLKMIRGRLVADQPALGKRLNAMIAATAAGFPSTDTALAVPAAGRRWPLSVIVSPLGRRQDSIFGEPGSVLVCVTDLNAQAELLESRVQALFALTTAEARVATAIFDGLSLSETALRLNVSVQTVRNQLKSVFEKTGVNRQTDLVRLLMRAAAPLQN